MNASIEQQKDATRIAGFAARKAQVAKESNSTRITDRMMQLPEYTSAKCVMWYVDVRDEVKTRHALSAALSAAMTSDIKVVVPYCVGDELELFLLESLDELESGKYKILEPQEELRSIERKRVDVTDVDLIVVPGVGFDARGGRVGNGKGYYDRCLKTAKHDTSLVALAFECQVFNEIPMGDHDIHMDKVITEQNIYLGKGRT